MEKINVTVWNENVHEKQNPAVRENYPTGIHGRLAEALQRDSRLNVRVATLEQEEHGLTEEVVNSTDVMIWWGHAAHDKVEDRIVDRVQQAVLSGMGLIVLHSGHYSKIFKRLMGTNCSLKWREVAEKERLWNLAPNHPITEGIGEHITLPNTEMYGERFDIPEPDQLIFVSWFEGGEVFRSGCTWNRGNGKIFYFRPGHETYPIFHNEEVLKVIHNSVHWAKRTVRIPTTEAPCIENPLETIYTEDTFSKAGIKGQ